MYKKEHLPDRSAFHKTKDEKIKTLNAKKQWKANMRLYFKDNWKKHNNYPFTLKDL